MMNAIDSLWVVLPVKTTLLLTLAWFLHVALARFNPRWRVLLWRGTACGVMLVAVWSFGLPVVEVGIPMPETTFAVPAFPPEPFGVEEVPIEAVLPEAVVSREMSMPIDPPPTAPRTPAVTVPTETSTANRASIPWRTVLLILWPLGITALALRLFAGHARLSRHLARSCMSAPQPILAEVGHIAGELGCRREIHVLQSPTFTVPFIFGIFRPILVLPEKMCRADYASRLPGILAHELSHVRSGDFAWNLILRAVSIPLWFHPLAWRIASAHRAACDAVCDAVSASYLGDVRGYCRTLAKVALEDATSTTFPAVGLAMARRCDVRRRVAALERAVFATPLRRRAVAATVAVGLLGAVLLAGVELTRAEVAAEDKPAARSRESSEDAENSGSLSPSEAAGADSPARGGKEQTEAPQSTTVTISGRVIEAIPEPELALRAITPVKKFRIKAGYERVAGSRDIFWRESWTVENEKGEYRIVWNTREKGRRAVRIEAEGYISTDPLFVDADKEDVTFGPGLVRGREVSGIVRAPDGTPARDAEIAPRFPHLDIGELYVRDGRLDRSFVRFSTRTDSEGRFSFGSLLSPTHGSLVSTTPVPIGAASMRAILFVVHDEGVAEVEVNEDSQDQDITLLPWARAEGTLRIAGKPAAGERVCLYLRETLPAKRPPSQYDLARKRITFDYATQTDSEGRFVFERVFPAEGRVVRCAVQQQGPMKAYVPTHSAKAKFARGKTTRVDIRRDGRPVVGELIIDLSDNLRSDCGYASALLVPHRPRRPQPEIPWPRRLVERKDQQALKQWLDDWKRTPAGQEYQATIERLEADERAASFATNVKPDGSFRFEDVPPGEYELRLKLQERPKEGEFFPGEVIAEASQSVTVPEMPDGRSDEVLETPGLLVRPVKQ